MLYRIYTLIFISSILVANCKKQKILRSSLKLGEGTESLEKLYINKLSVRDLKISGGDHNYQVNVEKSDIAKVQIASDTLRITGLLEGVTFATVSSMDERRRLEIHVVSQNLFFSQDTLWLYPGYDVNDQNSPVILGGGGESPNLKIEDTDRIMSVRWLAKNNSLAIRAYHEGVARIIATSQDGQNSQQLTVIVRSQDADSVNKTRGIYKTTNRYNLSNTLIKTTCFSRFCIDNQNSNGQSGGQNTIDCAGFECNSGSRSSSQSSNSSSSTTSPNSKGWGVAVAAIVNTGYYAIDTDNKRTFIISYTGDKLSCCSDKISGFVKGTRIPIKIQNLFQNKVNLPSGNYNLVVEDLSGDSLVTLRGAGFKIVMPIKNNTNKCPVKCEYGDEPCYSSNSYSR